MKIGDQIKVTIEKLTFGGSGLARLDGRVVFVPFSAPQDELLVEVTESKKNFLTAKIIEILTPSSQRAKPPCPLFYKCGGCNWQHLNYKAQLEAKQSIVQDIWERQLKENSSLLSPIEASPMAWNYRNRIQVKSKAQNTGFYARASHEIVNMKQCLIADEQINIFYNEWLKTKAKVEQLQLFNFKLNSKNKVTVTNIQTEEEPIGFSQVNTAQNQKLIEWVIETFKAHPQSQLLDLYGGPGNFAIPLAEIHPQLKSECVEFNLNAYKEGLRRKNDLKLTNLKMIQADVETYLNRHEGLENTFVILDPPREGCSQKVIDKLIALNPAAIIYISCDPMTWARDVKVIKTAYRAAKIQPIDMFPQTDHIEIFSLWLKASKN